MQPKGASRCHAAGQHRDTAVAQRDPTVTLRDTAVTLVDRRAVRLPYLQTSSVKTDIEIEFSVARTPRKHYCLPPSVVGGGLSLVA